jgi:hypothetical protein
MEGDFGESPVDAVDCDVEGPAAEDSNRRIAGANPRDKYAAPSTGEDAGKGKAVVRKSAFEQLPAEIIEQ